ncbi:MAG: SpoIID/LytB domain-containing protein, partial [Firmicutes bacterium]|nr:SpoIID/LytB domain-containing protein [Bacillota bacterium]
MNKKVLAAVSLIIMLILALSVYAGADDQSLNPDDYIRVGLYYGSTSKTSFSLSSDYGFDVYDENLNYIKHLDSKSLKISTGTEYNRKILMCAADDPDSRILNIAGKNYRDGCMIIENGGALRIINYVTLEHYAWGVVGREMSSSNPIEALKAQAVCARSFALTSTKHSGKEFNVCATTDCQVYGGVAAESPETIQACRETEGQMMYYGDNVVRAYYSAYSGASHTMSALDAWGSESAYLQSVNDIYTPEYTWATMYTMSEIRTRLLEAGYDDPGKVISISVGSRNANGAVMSLIIDCSKTTITINASRIMSVFNLKSLYFNMSEGDWKEIQKTEKSPESMYVLSAEGTSLVSTEELYVFNGESISKFPVLRAAEYTFEDEVCSKDAYLN